MTETTNSALDEAVDELNRCVPEEDGGQPQDFHAHLRRHLLATLGWGTPQPWCSRSPGSAPRADGAGRSCTPRTRGTHSR